MNNRTIWLYLLYITLERVRQNQTVAVTTPALSRVWRRWLGPCEHHWTVRVGPDWSPLGLSL